MRMRSETDRVVADLKRDRLKTTREESGDASWQSCWQPDKEVFRAFFEGTKNT